MRGVTLGDDVVATLDSEPQQTARRSRTAAVHLAGALAAGAALLLAFPPFELWWCAPLGVALLALVTWRTSTLAGAGLGLATGMLLFVPLLHWTAIDARIGWWPWLLLSLSQAGFVAVLGAASAWYARITGPRWWSWPPLTGGLWLIEEALRSRLPFGGFPWGRLAFSQAESPLAWLAALGGAPLVTFGVAFAGGLLAAAAWTLWRSPVTALDGSATSGEASGQAAGPAGWPRAAGLAGAALLTVLAGLAVPLQGGAGEAITVAIVQGNVPRIGLDFNAQRRAVLDNHVDATLDLAEDVAAGTEPQPDLVIWPENSSDIDPFVNSDAYQRIDEAADAIGAPILVGAVLTGPGRSNRNAGVVWWPDTGPGQRYVKQHPVPFAEYLPMRPLVRALTDKADLAGNFIPGDRPGVLRAGPAVLGDVICFEVAYDNLVRDTVTGGAELLVVQTNNATFNAAEASQQLAMVRLRAIEHGRPALMASTVGISGFVGPDGAVTGASGFNTRHVAVRTVRLRDGRTLATRLGVLPELGLGLATLAAMIAGWAYRRRQDTGVVRRHRSRPATAADGEEA